MDKALVVILVSLALSSSGRRVSILSKDAAEAASTDRSGSLESLSKMLLSFNPTFTASRPMRLSKQFARQHKTVDFQRAMTPLMRGGQKNPLEDQFGNVIGTASLLTLISGIVNIVAFMEVGIPCTHHTGSATHVGRLVGTTIEFGDLVAGSAGASILLLIVTYVMGAAVAGFSDCDGEKPYAGKISWGLCGSALAIAAGAILRHVTGSITPFLAILSFSQGLQNAITTSAAKFVGFPVRTTHVTGSATDLGSGLGQWLKASVEGKTPASLKKQMVFGAGIASFIVGGYVGRLLHPIFGALTAILPAALLLMVGFGRSGIAAIALLFAVGDVFGKFLHPLLVPA